MDLCIMKIKIGVIPFTHGIGDIKNTGFGLKGHPQSQTQESAVEIVSGNIVLRPPRIHEREQKRIQTDQVTILQRADRILCRQNALFIKSPQQLISAYQEKLV